MLYFSDNSGNSKTKCLTWSSNLYGVEYRVWSTEWENSEHTPLSTTIILPIKPQSIPQAAAAEHDSYSIN